MENIAFILGTRPEAIKLAPVISEFRNSGLNCKVIISGQQEKLAIDALSYFDIKPDFNLKCTNHGEVLSAYFSKLYASINNFVNSQRFSAVYVHGDTSTACVSALSGFLNNIPVFHIEAGLRTWDLANPYPEEGYRRIIDEISSLRFVPTLKSAQNLVRSQEVTITGNTGIDAVRILVEQLDRKWSLISERVTASFQLETPFVLVTLHRRESFGEYHNKLMQGILDLAKLANFVVVVHPNPNVSEAMLRTFNGHKKVKLIEPPGYLDFLSLMRLCETIITDSGGIQEEATSLGVPTLIARDFTERPEVLETDYIHMVGSDIERIRQLIMHYLCNPRRDRSFRTSPVGDGHSAKRILESYLDSMYS